MSGALRMAKLDLICMKPFMKSYLLLIFVAVYLSFMQSSTEMLATMMAVYMVMMMGSLFSIQEKNKLDRLYGALCVGNDSVVGGRYLFALLSVFVGVAMAVAVSAVMAGVRGETLVLSQEITGCVTAAVMGGIFVALQLPLYFRLGYTRARMIVMVPFLLLFLLVIAATSFFPEMADAINAFFARLEGNAPLAAAASVLLGVLVLLISYNLSLRMRRAANG